MREATFATVIVASVAILACESKEATPPTPSAAAAPAPTPAPTPEPEPAPKPSRPEKIDTALTDAKRATIEGAVAEAKGFVDFATIEEKLKANKALSSKEKAVPAFDRMASGKWILFTGPAVNLTESGFELGVTFTPQLPNDPMGMSRQWFPVKFSNIKGYEQSKFKDGQVVVVLAKYGGKQEVSEGQELVEAGLW